MSALPHPRLQHPRVQELKSGRVTQTTTSDRPAKTQTSVQIRRMQLQINQLQLQVADLNEWVDAHQKDDNEVRDDLAHLQKEVDKLKF